MKRLLTTAVLPFAFVACMLLPGAASGQAPPRGAASSQSEPASVLERVLVWFGFRRPTQLFRGGVLGPARELTDLDVWIMTANGAGARKLTSDRGYHTPVFSPDGQRLAAIHQSKIRIFRIDRRPQTHKDWPLPTRVTSLIGWNEKGIGLLAGKRVLVLDPERGALVAVAQGMTAPESELLLTAARTCRSVLASHAYQPGVAYSVPARYDVMVRQLPAEEGKLLTEKSGRRINAEPAFSPDCKRIAFVSR